MKTIEIDHIGAYLCVRKHLKSLNLQVLCPFIVYKCNKRRLKTHVFVTVQWLHYHLFLSCNVSLVSVKLCHLLPRKYFYILKKRFILDSSAEILTTIEDVSKNFQINFLNGLLAFAWSSLYGLSELPDLWDDWDGWGGRGCFNSLYPGPVAILLGSGVCEQESSRVTSLLFSTAHREGWVGLASVDVQNLYSFFNEYPCRRIAFGGRSMSNEFPAWGMLETFSSDLFRSSLIISLLLLRGNIEPNPGPPKLITVNCRGLSSKVKLLSTIGKLRKECGKNDAIIFLQETHLDDSELISSIWEGTTVIKSFLSSSQRGTMIILKGQFTINCSLTDPNGRYCIVNISGDLLEGIKSSFNLVNVYAPNNHKESLTFFTNLFESIEQCSSSLDHIPEMIIAGDFNFIFDENSDCQNRRVSNDEKVLAEFVAHRMQDLELWDLVQSSRASINFTWRREEIRSRIDYIFASSSVASRVDKFFNKWQLIKTDHAAVIVELSNSTASYAGRSYPKLSFNDIKEVEDKISIKEAILKAIDEFDEDWSPHTRLEYVKLMIRSKVLTIRAKRNKEINELDQLRIDLNNLEQLVSLNKNDLLKMSNLRSKLYKTEEIVEEQLRMKSGIKWREAGERSTKFFLNLIASKTNSSMSHKGFLDTNGVLVSNNKDVTDHAKNFYASLYADKSVKIDDGFFANCPCLGDEEQERIGNGISMDELKRTLKTCKDSTPGLDGIPYSFYKIYANLLLPLVLDSWHYGLQTGSLAPSHRQSCITIIPKVGKDLRLIRNWRPITVASCDLKIITKSLSLRMAKILPSIIYDTQMAYVPGRDINFNNRILSYVVNNTDETDDVIISFDAEKAFDSVSHDYLKRALQIYKFPESFINYFTVLYSNNSSVVQVNGHLSEPFNLERGVKQGDALSCSLFILAIDPLIRNIETNSQIKPIYIRSDSNSYIKVKTLGYADDIAVVTKGNASIQGVIEEYERLFHCSGLRLNADKTEVLRLTRNIHCASEPCKIKYLGKQIDIVPSQVIKVCGNHLQLDADERYKLNVTAKINSLSKILCNWSRRNLTPNGKMMIIKCHALSQLTFVNQFQNISNVDIKRIEAICYKFLWNGGPDRVKRSTLKLDKLAGGINGVDIESFLNAIKIRQFFKAESYCETLRFIQKNSPLKEDISLASRNYLAKLTRYCWKNIDIEDLSSDDRVVLANQDLRPFIKPNSKTNALLQSLQVSSLNEVVGLGRLITNKVVKFLPSIFRHLLRFDLPVISTPPLIVVNNKVKLMNKTSSRELQYILKSCLGKIKPYSVNNKYDGLNLGSLEEKKSWFNLWKLRNPILRNCRLKIKYKDVFCQQRRHKFGISDSSQCEICGELETVEHQIMNCNNARRMWKVYDKLFGKEIDFKNVITVDCNMTEELVKAVIIKLLIQIDRSRSLSINHIILRIQYMLNLEYSVSKNAEIKDVIKILINDYQ